MEQFCFSVSMCVYKGDDPNHFDQAINSVIDQTLQPNEIVLTVDGPIPDTIEFVIQKYRNLLTNSSIDFKTVYLPQNVGHGGARRTCLENCSNELIALMDADDLSVPERFQKQISFFENNSDVSAVGGNISEFITDPKQSVGKRVVHQRDAEIKKYMKKRCPMNQVTVMFKKSAVDRVGGYQDWYCEEDYFLWLRMALAGMQFANLDCTLVNVRVGEEMYSRRGGWKYFKSERRLQKFMKKNKVIGFATYMSNVTKRFVIQVLLPNRIRGWVFKKFARS